MSRATALTRTAILLAALAFALTACASPGAGEGKAPAHPGASDPGGGTAGGTAAGQNAAENVDEALPMGKVSRQTFKDSDKSVEVAIEPLAVRRGKHADLAGRLLKGKENKVPYYVDVRYTHRGGDTLSAPYINLNLAAMIDERNQAVKLSLAHPFPGCEGRKDSIKRWTEGATHVECSAFLVPEDQKIAYLWWSPDPSNPEAKPIMWKNG